MAAEMEQPLQTVAVEEEQLDIDDFQPIEKLAEMGIGQGGCRAPFGLLPAGGRCPSGAAVGLGCPPPLATLPHPAATRITWQCSCGTAGLSTWLGAHLGSPCMELNVRVARAAPAAQGSQGRPPPPPSTRRPPQRAPPAAPHAADIKKVKEGGIHTVEALRMTPKKDIYAIKGLSEAKADKMIEVGAQGMSSDPSCPTWRCASCSSACAPAPSAGLAFVGAARAACNPGCSGVGLAVQLCVRGGLLSAAAAAAPLAHWHCLGACRQPRS